MFTRKKLIATLLLAFATFIVAAQDDSKNRTRNFNLEDGLAIQGYDPVAYVADGKAVEGEKGISHEFKGVQYRFSSVNHKEMFIAHPELYEPQYGGWCAYAMGSTGEKVEVDPETFKIVDGKLYLFYNAYFNNTLKKWNEDEAKLKNKADANWIKLIKL